MGDAARGVGQGESTLGAGEVKRDEGQDEGAIKRTIGARARAGASRDIVLPTCFRGCAELAVACGDKWSASPPMFL